MLKNIHIRYILVIALLLGYIYLQRSCQGSYIPEKEIIVTNPKSGRFDNIKPVQIKVPVYKYITTKGDTITLENPLNKELASKYERETDSLKRRIMYYEAIQTRKYNGRFENKDLIVDIEASTTGTLDSVRIPYYLIKPDTIEKYKPKPVFSMYLGAGVYGNKDQHGFKLNLGLQGDKGGILRLSYDPINKMGFVEKDIRLFERKR